MDGDNLSFIFSCPAFQSARQPGSLWSGTFDHSTPRGYYIAPGRLGLHPISRHLAKVAPSLVTAAELSFDDGRCPGIEGEMGSRAAYIRRDGFSFGFRLLESPRMTPCELCDLKDELVLYLGHSISVNVLEVIEPCSTKCLPLLDPYPVLLKRYF